MFTKALDFNHFVQPHLFCGQIAYIPSPCRGKTQKTTVYLRVTPLKQHAGPEWGAATAKTLCIANLSLDCFRAEYWASVWCRSANTRVIDGVLYDALRIVN